MLPDLTIRSLILGATWFQKEKGKKKKKEDKNAGRSNRNEYLAQCMSVTLSSFSL